MALRRLPLQEHEIGLGLGGFLDQPIHFRVSPRTARRIGDLWRDICRNSWRAGAFSLLPDRHDLFGQCPTAADDRIDLRRLEAEARRCCYCCVLAVVVVCNGCRALSWSHLRSSPLAPAAVFGLCLVRGQCGVSPVIAAENACDLAKASRAAPSDWTGSVIAGRRFDRGAKFGQRARHRRRPRALRGRLCAFASASRSKRSCESDVGRGRGALHLLDPGAVAAAACAGIVGERLQSCQLLVKLSAGRNQIIDRSRRRAGGTRVVRQRAFGRNQLTEPFDRDRFRTVQVGNFQRRAGLRPSPLSS